MLDCWGVRGAYPAPVSTLHFPLKALHFRTALNLEKIQVQIVGLPKDIACKSCISDLGEMHHLCLVSRSSPERPRWLTSQGH